MFMLATVAVGTHSSSLWPFKDFFCHIGQHPSAVTVKNMTWVSSAVVLEKVACVGHNLIIQTAEKTIHSSPCGCDGILQPLSPFC